jgi:RNA polymerase sigma-70 factor, ECF subfamily
MGAGARGVPVEADRCFRLKAKLDKGSKGELARAVALAQAGDTEGYRYLYVRFADNIFSFVRKIVCDDHDAEDVTQQVFAKLFSSIGRYETQKVPFSAWILRVARNAAIDHMRRDRLIPTDDVCGGDHDFAEIGHDRRRMLTDALRLLPRDQREVVMLRHLVGLTPGEIASRMGKSESAIHGLHHRGRRSLQHELELGGVAPALAAA